jgi:hypothetical protein
MTMDRVMTMDTRATDPALSQALDELYSAPFEAFVGLRRELASRLRSAGDAAAARSIAAAEKPTRTAWAINQVARRRPDLLAAIIEGRKSAATAQTDGDADRIRETARRYRECLAGAVREVRSVLAEAGVSLSAAHARRTGETLQALSTDDGERAKLSSGRLTRDVTVEDPFAGLALGATTHRATGRQAKAPADQSSKTQDLEAARRREAERARRERERAIDEARARVTAMEHAVVEARRTAAEADRVALRARHEAEAARSALDSLERDISRAREELKRRTDG